MKGMDRRKQPDRKIWLLAACVLTGVAVLACCLWLGGTADKAAPGELVITNLDVGKGDACVIRYNDFTGVIDTGIRERYSVISDYLEDNGIETLDLLILTHFDRDHIGGAERLMEKYPSAKLVVPDYRSEKDSFLSLQNALAAREDVDRLSTPAAYSVGELLWEVYPAGDENSFAGDEASFDNNMSLVVMLTYGERRFLFTGDIESDRIDEMLTAGYDLHADWIKMPHHGDYQKAQKALLRAVGPAYAVISTGREQPVEDKTVNLLAAHSVSYYSTADGAVITRCDGKSVSVEQQTK